MRHPRRALAIGLVFVVTGIVYWLVSYEPAGSAALILLGVAMSIMAYALANASPDEL